MASQSIFISSDLLNIQMRLPIGELFKGSRPIAVSSAKDLKPSQKYCQKDAYTKITSDTR